MTATCDTTLTVEEREREGFVSNRANKKTKKQSTKCLLVILVLLILLAGLAVGIYFIVEATSKPTTPFGTISNPGQSCLHLLINGVNDNGYYFIKIDGVSDIFEVYCDMKTSGGGWTLVASVHQFDEENCTYANKWYGNASSTESRNWENTHTFGDLKNATVADYKNPAYFALKASDVMISHMPSNSSILASEEEANLQYHTEDGFLEDYGSNFFQAFSNYYPLVPSDNGIPDEEPSVLDEILDSLEASGSDLYDVYVPPLYQYVYDDQHPDRLTNGGNNLFDPYGMKVSINGPDCSIDGINYGQVYNECGNIASKKSYPFFALLNTGASPNEYRYTIDSRQSSQDSQRKQYFLSIFTINDYGIFYQAICELSNNIPSYCDITFTVYSEKNWNSTKLDDSSLSHTDFTSSHTNAVYGYTMIAREPGKIDTEMPFRVIVHRLYDILSQFPTIGIEAMLDELERNSSDIVDVSQPLPYEYKYEVNNRIEDRLSDDEGLFLPYGMKIEAFTSSGIKQSLEYGKSYKFDDGLVQVTSRKSYPFFALMKMNNPNLLKYAGLTVEGGRPRTDERIFTIKTGRSITNGDYYLNYHSHCSYNLTLPSICDVIFVIVNHKDWNSQDLPFSNRTTIFNDNNASAEYIFYKLVEQSEYTNAIMGYTLLSRQPGQIHLGFPLDDIMMNILSLFTQFSFIGLQCSDRTKNLVVPVKFTIGSAVSFTNRIPNKFQTYTPGGFLQLRAATFDGDYYALCPGVRVDTCEPEHVCVGGVKNAKEQVCNSYLDWPPNGTSYSFPGDSYYPSDTLFDIRSNILIFYR